ncbi:hypothetical protein MPTK1_5g23750 [Marchantia polymorpha subsp. ruderalis]|uniref:Uncharacterized protein n=2 Tax=Marchantia polymorpha TaxID=3197 RepID=A0AAF6BLK8_MARPO|nr:hypothetical protein MARPO_0010s0081 [Marchantia polymorpha]BBN12892.1 hypothetical protein Mp_5g23750 [Marchantia polymorpha subsp. ruderalis]|eukprot:PTQ46682.1 hypothetical protein MARPO_0010s0081 [Marchantia polymorpha]
MTRESHDYRALQMRLQEMLTDRESCIGKLSEAGLRATSHWPTFSI